MTEHDQHGHVDCEAFEFFDDVDFGACGRQFAPASMKALGDGLDVRVNLTKMALG
jgi:hypothetical protein